MTEPTTEADFCPHGEPWTLSCYSCGRDVVAEAVAAERARIAEAVRGLEGYDALWDGGDLCARAAVLALLEPTDERKEIR